MLQLIHYIFCLIRVSYKLTVTGIPGAATGSGLKSGLHINEQWKGLSFAYARLYADPCKYTLSATIVMNVIKDTSIRLIAEWNHGPDTFYVDYWANLTIAEF